MDASRLRGVIAERGLLLPSRAALDPFGLFESAPPGTGVYHCRH